jgi:NTP pyrophosphatase (non-canonical NTP hydrolase)
MKTKSINEYCKEAYKTARLKGFYGTYAQYLKTDPRYFLHLRNKAEMIALMHSELSEALEALRSTDQSKNNVGEEFADCCIRVFDYCGAFNIDLEKEILKKMKINAKRAIKHNKNF